ncbi:16S rRNA (cytosine(1402)-N(4))-methyltransferase RsmH [Desulfobotulus sp. H1]|uniref:Ribosomal RNA small subunit methyltransferase H n=1 Tax=Desulfobotulus pelophilus TaxID=2823377 RepID=A0ABT3N527_9BACT|nr:16S rRNA (cytosine(1402)-N(4))-methyltransferase RsmH [Desulfobotulus pelophilus]MCW7752562.1 16S rRNA (cytosine(1402)-N(4))-methyltransferase RsmH [Desulfobotulus pelophilus]
MEFHHISCMPAEVLTFLHSEKEGIYVDATLGGCGHARRILESSGPETRIIGIDQDTYAIAHAREKLASFGRQVEIVHGNFSDIGPILDDLNIPAVDGILADLGLSLYQLEASGRGFSFRGDEPLDMRMNPKAALSAAELVNTKCEQELKTIFREFGEERFAGPIARRIVEARKNAPVTSTGQLADIIQKSIPTKHRVKQKIHPATRVFMALRIAVNQELDRLDTFLETAPRMLRPGGRMVVLSFHSLEDRRVKQAFRKLAFPCTCPPDFPVCNCGKQTEFQLQTIKAVKPGSQEVLINPMARSTRLRALQRLT